jgi:hypothetical protein
MLEVLEIADFVDFSTIGGLLTDAIFGLLIVLPTIIIARRIKNQNQLDLEWGLVEQNALERLSEDGVEFIPATEFLNWLSELEQGREI